MAFGATYFHKIPYSATNLQLGHKISTNICVSRDYQGNNPVSHKSEKS